MTWTKAQWALMGAVGVLLLFPGPIPLLCLAIAAYRGRQDWGVAQRGDQLARIRDWAFWLPAVIVAVVLVSSAPMPRDDLLAIASIATGDFAHTSFIGSEWGAFGSPWIGFEWLVAQLVTVFGDKGVAVRILQVLAVGATLLLVGFAVRKEMPSSKRQWVFALIILALILRCGLPMRAVGARCEAFFALLVPLALIVRPWVWVVAGVAMAPLYWLAPIYAPAALLLKAPLRVRVLAASLYVAASCAIWLAFTDGNWLGWLVQTQAWVGNRIGGPASVSENAPVFQALGYPAVVMLIGIFSLLASRGALRKDDWPLGAVALWFLLPDMIRYIPLVMTVVGIWVARMVERQPMSIESNRAACWIVAPLAAWYLVHGANFAGSTEPDFHLPPGARVFSEPATSFFKLVYSSRGIELAPSFEPGADARDIQSAVLGIMSKGEVSCEFLKKYRFDFLAEKSLRSIPPCVSPDQVAGQWRLWRIVDGVPRP